MSDNASSIDLVPQQQLGLFSLIHGDQLGTALGRFAITSPLVAAVITAATGFTAALVTLLEGNFINSDLSLDLFHDIGWWNQFVLAIATLVYIAGAYFGSFPRTLNQLVDSGVLLATDKEWKQVRRFAKVKLGSSTIVLLPYVCGGASALLSFFVIHAPGAWFDVDTYYAGWLVPLHSFTLYFTLSYLALRLYLAFLILRMLFSYKVNIQPFHTDGCGGLGSLKQQSASLYIGLLVYGLVAAVAVISNTVNYGVELTDTYNLGLIGSYIIITSVAFFVPLYATSASMKKAKEKFLLSIKQRYKQIQRKVDNDVVGRGSNEDILALGTLRATARSMQVWPFDYATLIKFVAVVTSPIYVVALYVLLTG